MCAMPPVPALCRDCRRDDGRAFRQPIHRRPHLDDSLFPRVPDLGRGADRRSRHQGQVQGIAGASV